MENVTFKELNLSKEIQKAISKMGFEEATPIQALSIPHILKGNDVIGQAQTGTGKTCAFGIPAIEMIDTSVEGIQVLALCPTRELAIQISEELKSVTKYKKGIRILPVYGGQPIDRQIAVLKKRPQIIIGTPGRIMDHMRRRTLKLQDLRMLVLDEADEMLNMGFRDDIDTILKSVPQKKQTVFFSATMPKEILDLTAKYQKDPVHVKAAHKELTVPSIEQFYIDTSETAKLEVLSRLIDTHRIKLALVFCNTKRRVDGLVSSLQTRGYMAEGLHGDMKQVQRDKVMSRFRKGGIEVLVATDVAARGIDVDNVEVVFNYDLPNDEEYYVHRIGRTGRAGKTGKAYTFVVGREIYKLKEIQRYTKSKIVPQRPPTLLDVEENKMTALSQDLKDIIAQGQHSKYIRHIEKILESSNRQDDTDSYMTPLDVAAGLLSMIVGKENTGAHSISEIDSPTEDMEGETVRLFINIGREHKIQPKNIIESISSNTGLAGNLIGAIKIFDKFTFVDVPGEYALEVMASMKNNTLKGRKINVEKAKRKDSK